MSAAAAPTISVLHLGGPCWVLLKDQRAWYAAKKDDGSFEAFAWAGLHDRFGDIHWTPEPTWEPFSYTPLRPIRPPPPPPTVLLTGISARQDALRLRRHTALAADAAAAAGKPFVPTFRLAPPSAAPAIKKPSLAL